MAKRRLGGVLVLSLGLLLLICNTIIPTFMGQIGAFFHIPLIGISILMLCRCSKSDVLADVSAAFTGCAWGILMGIGLVAGWLKLITQRRQHPYDEAAYGIIFVIELCMAVIILLIDIVHNAKKLSFRRFLLQGAITICITPLAMGPAYVLMLIFEIILSGYV